MRKKTTAHMRLLTFIALFSVFSFVSAGEMDELGCGEPSKNKGKVFELNMSLSFHGDVEYKLCRNIDKYILLVETSKSNNKEILELKSNEVEIILKKYEKALEYNTKDKEMGLDGSSWCLETKRGFTYLKACFWSPGYEPQKRGLAGLNDLGTYLFDISKLKENGFVLY